jgi:hypothetical protein
VIPVKLAGIEGAYARLAQPRRHRALHRFGPLVTPVPYIGIPP